MCHTIYPTIGFITPCLLATLPPPPNTNYFMPKKLFSQNKFRIPVGLYFPASLKGYPTHNIVAQKSHFLKNVCPRTQLSEHIFVQQSAYVLFLKMWQKGIIFSLRYSIFIGKVVQFLSEKLFISLNKDPNVQ